MASRVKRVRHAGRGALPEYPSGTKVRFHFRVELLPSDPLEWPASSDALTLVEDSRKPWPDGYGQAMELVFGKKFQLPVWEKCLESMHLDEGSFEISSFDVGVEELHDYPMVSKKLRDIAKGGDGHAHGHSHGGCFGMTAQLGTGYQALDELLKAPQPLRFTLHLLSVQRPEDYEAAAWQLNDEQRLASVEELRRRGNEQFAARQCAAAAALYTEAIGRLDTLMLKEKPRDTDWLRLDEQKVPLLLNLCQCRLNERDFYEAARVADEALQRDPDSEKGLYRRAVARIGIWDLEGARADLERLAQVHPKAKPLADRQLAGIDELQRKLSFEDQNRFKGMFSTS